MSIRPLRVTETKGGVLRQHRQHRRYELGAPALANRRRETRPRVTRRCVSIVSIAHRLTSTIGAENEEVGGNRNLSSPRLAEDISSINLSFARLNGLTNLTLCNKNPACRSAGTGGQLVAPKPTAARPRMAIGEL
jgi:hypothetical protein